MENKIAIYSGKIRRHASSAEEDSGLASAERSQLPDAEQSWNEIEAEAASAIGDVRELDEETKAKLERDYEMRLAQRLTDTFLEVHTGIDSAAGAITAIVETAIRRIIGDSASPQNVLVAIKQSISDYETAHAMRVIVAPKDYSRLGELLRGAKATGELKGIKLVKDRSFAPGQCVLDTGEQRFNVGIEAQIAALRKAIEKSAHKLDTSGGKDLTGKTDDTISNAR